MKMLAAFLNIASRARLLRRGFCVPNVFAGRAPFLILLFFFFSSLISAQTLRIAAAADLQFVLPDLAAQYEKQTGVKLAITYGSSGNFFAQIQNGAPFDLFLSADTDYPKKLVDAGLAVPESLQVYAGGRLVLWCPNDSPINPVDGLLLSLLDPRVEKIAIANPEHAPYGRAAVAAMRNYGVYDRLKPKLVFGENVSQAAQFVQSGNAQAGLIAFSLVLSPAMKDGRWVEIVLPDRPKWLSQSAVILKSSSNKTAAASFLTFLKTPEAQSILKSYGFHAPRQASTGSANP
jgi:molybdate transport system substrate-binding protein